MTGSHNKHELDIPILDPENYFVSFFEKRDTYYTDSSPLDDIAFGNYLTSTLCPPDSNTIDIIYTVKTHLINGIDTNNDFITKLQLKFALFGRIATSYTKEFRKNSEDIDNQELYLLVALLFYTLYKSNNDLNIFNTAIKIADKALSYGKSESPIFSKMISVEQSILKELYA